MLLTKLFHHYQLIQKDQKIIISRLEGDCKMPKSLTASDSLSLAVLEGNFLVYFIMVIMVILIIMVIIVIIIIIIMVIMTSLSLILAVLEGDLSINIVITIVIIIIFLMVILMVTCSRGGLFHAHN